MNGHLTNRIYLIIEQLDLSDSLEMFCRLFCLSATSFVVYFRAGSSVVRHPLPFVVCLGLSSQFTALSLSTSRDYLKKLFITK